MKRSDLILPDYPLKEGDRGLHVARLQACFDTIYKLKGKKKLESIEPSYFGRITSEYVLVFQENEGIKRTAVYDRQTRQKLREVLQCR